MQSLWEVLETRLVRRKVPLKNMKRGEIERGANDTVRRVVTLQQGIPTEAGREIVKFLKDRKLKKVQPAIQGDQLRISSGPATNCRPSSPCSASRTSAWNCSSATTASKRAGDLRSHFSVPTSPF